ncbi:Cpr4p [Saccharomyces cerevisiae YJM1208]|nr:Cpr4p [Saccharomyces cerevisiae YJM1208]AJQ43456.1 Cpr4p [Saccharomyces cerevisiae YJM1615]CAD6605857.1 HLJ1_G0052110.mRNA.1.CDS.1 [Saccharomyces cerevisiae]CAI4303325.1 BAI_1a_G0006080.mRNA.1.CDS.1 [Saccharomyces cerevisiae]CAI7056708.1 BAI_1a_G0006080.mRNA.1.CDS.1 [Saccharomyces cerevisiae]
MWLKSLLLCLYSLVLCQVHAAPSSGKQITSKDVDLQKKYEPSPPATHRGIITIEYFDPVSKSMKEADLTFELYGTVVPKTVNNFAKLAHGVKAVIEGKDPNDIHTYSYRKTKINKVYPNKYIQGGVVAPDVGPFTLYGPKFDDENFYLKHDRPGRLAMAYFGPDSNTSEFIITTKADGNEELDGKSVVFGQITSGLDELMDVIQYTETDEYGKPQHELRFLYFVLEILKISNILDLHAAYTEKVEKFRNGDVSVGSTLENIFRNDKAYTPLTTSTGTTAYDLNHPISRALMCLTVLGLCFIAYKGMHEKPHTVSLRHK